MARIAGGRSRAFIFVAVLLPLWSSYLIRVYIWRLILAHDGVLNWSLQKVGLPAANIGYTNWAVWLIFTYIWLPFMILPVYGALERVPKAQTDADGRTSPQALPEVLVRGKRSLDVDIRRSRDDIQPYVVFDAEQIARSSAQNIEDFLQSHLPMNAQQTTTSQIGPQTQAVGRIDLRGLGTEQTLILVDGRRLPSISTGDSFGQPNINGISLSQVERIEILPATASGIYGGGATGGWSSTNR